MVEQTFEDILNESGKLFYKNVGISMMPLIREGKDFIYITKRPEERLKKLDVAFFRRPYVVGRGRYVLHRVLRVNKDGTYWIIGDNCRDGEIVKEEDILGILSAVKRGNKLIYNNNFFYKLYVYFWCAPYPVRIFLQKYGDYPKIILTRPIWSFKKLLKKLHLIK